VVVSLSKSKKKEECDDFPFSIVVAKITNYGNLNNNNLLVEILFHFTAYLFVFITSLLLSSSLSLTSRFISVCHHIQYKVNHPCHSSTASGLAFSLRYFWNVVYDGANCAASCQGKDLNGIETLFQRMESGHQTCENLHAIYLGRCVTVLDNCMPFT
jgi:hypothetical protein